jgi:hypothetical protein
MPPAKLKHFSAQAAIDPQSPMSHGLAAGGQQSCIGSEADISAASCVFESKAAPATAGNKATDAAIRRANMVRANAIGRQYPAAAGRRSSDDLMTNA